MEEEIYPNPNPSKDALRYVHLVSSSGIDFDESQRYYREWAVRYDQEMLNIRYRGPHYAVDLLIDYIHNCNASQLHPNTASVPGRHRAAYQRRHSSFVCMKPATTMQSSPSSSSATIARVDGTAGMRLTTLTPNSTASQDDVNVLTALPVRIADIGCGTGLLVEQLQSRISSGQQIKLERKLQIDGLDCSAAMLEQMPKDRRKVYNKLVCKRIENEDSLLPNIPEAVNGGSSEGVEVVSSDNSKTPDLDFGKYDIAVACNTFALNHLDPRRGIDALCRLVRAGGYVIIVMRAYATSADELHYFKQALEQMSQLERNGLWRRVWCSTALDIYDFSASKQGSSSQTYSGSRRGSNNSGTMLHNFSLRPAKLLVYCKAQVEPQSVLPRRSRRSASRSSVAEPVPTSASIALETVAQQAETITIH